MDPVTTKLLLQYGLPILGNLLGRKKRKREQRNANAQMKEAKSEYMNLDFSNPYTDMKNPYDNMENPYEDLTVNLKQADFMANQQAQRDVNVLDSLQGAAGGSGIAGLAQSVYNQKVKKGQQAAGSIGMQESRNQALSAKGQGNIDMAQRKMEGVLEQRERAGEVYSRNKNQQRTETLYGMAMQRSTAANNARKSATTSLFNTLGQGLSSFAGTQQGADFFGASAPAGFDPLGDGIIGSNESFVSNDWNFSGVGPKPQGVTG